MSIIKAQAGQSHAVARSVLALAASMLLTSVVLAAAAGIVSHWPAG